MAASNGTSAKQLRNLFQNIRHFHDYPSSTSYGSGDSFVNKTEALRTLRYMVPKYRSLDDSTLINHLHDTWVKGKGSDVRLLNNLVQEWSSGTDEVSQVAEKIQAAVAVAAQPEPQTTSSANQHSNTSSGHSESTSAHYSSSTASTATANSEQETDLPTKEGLVSPEEIENNFSNTPATDLHANTYPIDAAKEVPLFPKEKPTSKEEINNSFTIASNPEVVKVQPASQTVHIPQVPLPVNRLPKIRPPQFVLNGYSKFKVWMATTRFPAATFMGAVLGGAGGFGLAGALGAGLGAAGGAALGRYISEEGNPYQNYIAENSAPFNPSEYQQRTRISLPNFHPTNKLLRKGAEGLAKTATKQAIKKGLIAAIAADPITWVIIGAFFIVLGLIFLLPAFFQLMKTDPLAYFNTTSSFVSPYTGSGDLGCYTSMSAEDINKYFSSNGYNNFIGTGDTFVSAAQQYKINPALIIAVGIQESALGNAYQGKPSEGLKNAFGLMGSNGLQSFSSWGDGAQESFLSIDKYKCTSIDCIGSKYAPIGASNDPNHLNDAWVPGVTKTFSSIPQTSCTSAIAAAPDYPTGWPTTGFIYQLPFDPSGDHCKGTIEQGCTNANAVDIDPVDGKEGQPVYSTLNGIATVVSYTWPQGYDDKGYFEGYWGYGVFVIIKNQATGAEAIYAHLVQNSDANIKEGQVVTKGMQIGLMDSSGNSTGNHLHYQITGTLQNADFGKFVPGGEPFQNEKINTVGNPGEWGPNSYTPSQPTPTP